LVHDNVLLESGLIRNKPASTSADSIDNRNVNIQPAISGVPAGILSFFKSSDVCSRLPVVAIANRTLERRRWASKRSAPRNGAISETTLRILASCSFSDSSMFDLFLWSKLTQKFRDKRFAGHSHATVNHPFGNNNSSSIERVPPGLNMLVNAVNEGPIQVKKHGRRFSFCLRHDCSQSGCLDASSRIAHRGAAEL
jgi:hypothetical protein